MRYTIDTLQNNTLDWNAKDDKRILQNISNLLTTWRYEVAYDRTKGLDPAILDLPQSDAIALSISEIYRLIETYQPDVYVVSVEYIGSDEQFNLQFKVVIET